MTCLVVHRDPASNSVDTDKTFVLKYSSNHRLNTVVTCAMCAGIYNQGTSTCPYVSSTNTSGRIINRLPGSISTLPDVEIIYSAIVYHVHAGHASRLRLSIKIMMRDISLSEQFVFLSLGVKSIDDV